MKDIFWLADQFDAARGDEESNGSDDNNIVSAQDNNIYFYSEVSRPKVLSLNKSITRVSNSIRNRSTVLEADDIPIKLHICSYGGSVFSGFAAVDYIAGCKVPVHSYIDGCAASAATLMSCVAEKRYMHRNACMLVHQLSGLMWGKFQEMQDDMQNSEMLMEKIKNIYREHTKIPKKELDNILKHDIWWEAEKCLQYGLVDELI